MNEQPAISPVDSRIEAREEAAFRKAAEVAGPLRSGRTFFDWLDLGEGLAALRDRAMRQSYSNSPFGKGYTTRYAALKAEHAWAGLFDPSTISYSIWLHENRTDVQRWRETLSSKQKQEWVTPKVVKSHYEAAHKVAEAKKAGIETLSPMAKQREAIIVLEEENTKLKRELAKRESEGSLFDLARDTAASIAGTIVGNVSEARAGAIYKALGLALKARSKPAG